MCTYKEQSYVTNLLSCEMEFVTQTLLQQIRYGKEICSLYPIISYNSKFATPFMWLYYFVYNPL